MGFHKKFDFKVPLERPKIKSVRCQSNGITYEDYLKRSTYPEVVKRVWLDFYRRKRMNQKIYGERHLFESAD